MSVWTGAMIAEHLSKDAPIKVGPNGVDVGVSEIWQLPENGVITIDGDIRTIDPPKKAISPQGNYYTLGRGIYELRLANRIDAPKNVAFFMMPRSTFNRLGIIKSQSAVGDAGYCGYCTQTIMLNHGLKIHKDEMWFQIIFMDLSSEPEFLYSGHWQNEGKK